MVSKFHMKANVRRAKETLDRKNRDGIRILPEFRDAWGPEVPPSLPHGSDRDSRHRKRPHRLMIIQYMIKGTP